VQHAARELGLENVEGCMGVLRAVRAQPFELWLHVRSLPCLSWSAMWPLCAAANACAGDERRAAGEIERAVRNSGTTRSTGS